MSEEVLDLPKRQPLLHVSVGALGSLIGVGIGGGGARRPGEMRFSEDV